MKCSLGISNFLKEISSLSHSVVFLYFFALITEEDFLISPCYSLELCIQMGISFLFSFAFSFSSQLFVKTPLTTILSFCNSFSPGWSWYLSSGQTGYGWTNTVAEKAGDPLSSQLLWRQAFNVGWAPADYCHELRSAPSIAATAAAAQVPSLGR